MHIAFKNDTIVEVSHINQFGQAIAGTFYFVTVPADWPLPIAMLREVDENHFDLLISDEYEVRGVPANLFVVL